MKLACLKILISALVGLVLVAVPGYCSAVLTFSVGTPSGTIQLNGTDNSTSTMTAFSGISFNQVIISGAANNADNGTWTLTNTTENWSNTNNLFYLNATFSSCSGCGGTPNLTGLTFSNLVSGTMTFTNGGAAPSYSVSNSSGNITTLFGTATSLSGIDSAFLTDLGAPSSYALITSGGISAPGFNFNSSTNRYTASSESLTLSLVPTPEPGSAGMLLGAGLLLVTVRVRRRTIQA